MWDLPRDQLWMALPCWDDLRSEHAPLLDEVGLKLWLAIATNAGPTGPFPSSRFFFSPEGTRSSLSCFESGLDPAYPAGEIRTQARLRGEWLVEFERGVVLSLGTGTMSLGIDDSPQAGMCAKAQRGYIEFGDALSANARISPASVRRFFELTGQTVISDHTVIELTTFIRINGVEPGSGSVYGPRDALAFCGISLATPRQFTTVPTDRPALIIRGYGPRKLEVVRLLMHEWQAGASEVMARIGDLGQPLELMMTDSPDIGTLLDLAEKFAAAGADVQVAAAGRYRALQ